MRKSFPLLACIVLVVSIISPVGAATINFINPSAPPQSQVIGVVDVTASGNSIGPQYLSQLTATSTAATVLGPTPPPFTAIGNARAELASDLYLTSPGTTRTITAPFSSLGFFAEGSGSAVSDSYTASADVYSGDDSTTAAGTWTIHVDPTGVEVPGTPTLITLDASIVGELEVVGTSSADATWLVGTNFGTVMNGSASQLTPALTPFSDSGSLSFNIPLGTTFQLTLLYQLNAAGTGISNSRAEVFSALAGDTLADEATMSLLTITAEVGAVVPEPSSLALLSLGCIGLVAFRRRRRI